MRTCCKGAAHTKSSWMSNTHGQSMEYTSASLFVRLDLSRSVDCQLSQLARPLGTKSGLEQIMMVGRDIRNAICRCVEITEWRVAG